MGLATLGLPALASNPGSDEIEQERTRERQTMISTTASFLAMTSDEASEVFRSMKVETTSKTPYSDATQVGQQRFPSVFCIWKIRLQSVSSLSDLSKGNRVESVPIS